MSAKLPRPQTNRTRTGTLTAVTYAPSSKPEYNDEIKLEGRWEQEGDGHWYGPLTLATALARAGLIRQQGFDAQQRPRFEVISQQQRVAITKREGQGNTRFYEALPVDGLGNLPGRALQVHRHHPLHDEVRRPRPDYVHPKQLPRLTVDH